MVGTPEMQEQFPASMAGYCAENYKSIFRR
jgi:hypothetical protein